MKNNVEKIIEANRNVSFPEGTCCANRCADCRHINMGSMDSAGKCHCREMGRWVYPSDPACHYFKW